MDALLKLKDGNVKKVTLLEIGPSENHAGDIIHWYRDERGVLQYAIDREVELLPEVPYVFDPIIIKPMTTPPVFKTDPIEEIKAKLLASKDPDVDQFIKLLNLLNESK